jgi:hypothetical protein
MINVIQKIAICIVTLFLGMTPSFSQTPEIPNYDFPDIAAVFSDLNSPTGAIIVYNPTICAEIRRACIFFKFHEHGHVFHRHHLNPQIPPVIRERDADNFSARNAPADAVFSAWNLFRNGGSSSNWHTYGSPQARALRLCRFAIQAGNWIGPQNC